MFDTCILHRLVAIGQACVLGLLLCGQGLCDLSYTVTQTHQSASGETETFTQRCKFKGGLLLSETRRSGSKEVVEQLWEIEKGVLYIFDRKEKSLIMIPIPDDDPGAMEGAAYEVVKTEETTREGKSCSAFVIKESIAGTPSAKMEIQVTQEVQEDLAMLWRVILRGIPGSQQGIRDQVQGFPLLYKRQSLTNQDSQTLEVTELDTQPLPEKVFALPKGFTIQCLPSSPYGPVKGP